jgi:hypothetical protein
MAFRRADQLRLVPHLIRSTLTPTLSLRVAELVERILFPLDGYPSPSPPDLTPAEASAARTVFEARLEAALPGESVFRRV